MVRLYALCMFLLSAVTAVAASRRCPGCFCDMLESDRFCMSCGREYAANTFSSASPAAQTPVVEPYHVQSARRSASSAKRSCGSSDGKLRSYDFAINANDSGIATPLKFSVVNGFAVPWDVACSVYGVNLAVIGSFNHRMCGISVSGLGNNTRYMYGLDIAFISDVDEAYGFQTGFYCIANKLRGVQIGVINFAGKDTCGLQIGAINFIGTYSDNITLPVVNMKF